MSYDLGVMRQDIWKICVALLAALALGLSSGFTLQALLVASLSCLAWLLYRLHRLYKWVINRSNEPPSEYDGMLYVIYCEIHRRNKKYKARKRQLTKHLKQFRNAVAVIPESIILLDHTGKIEWANSKTQHMLGIQWPRDAGIRFTDLVRDQRCIDLLQDVDGNPNGVEITSPVNRELTLNFNCARYADDKMSMIIVRDVSHLIKVNRLHKNFVANVSHELKTPLTVLKGYLEIMSQHPDLPANLQPPVNQMTAQSDRMQMIVKDLLYLAKLEDRSYITDHEPVDITRLVNTIIESIQPIIERKRHKIDLDIDYRLKLLGSEGQLSSAFANLINNACAYTDDGGVINIGWRACKGGAEFSVKDNGTGIEAAHLPQLTRRFYRVDDDRSRDSGGTGLGLAIVKHVLQRHNAELKITSSVGMGSEFRCIFPQTQLISQQQQSSAVARSKP